MALVADNYLDLTMFSSQDVLILQHIPQQGTTSNPLQTLTAEESTNKKPSVSTHPSFSVCTMIRNSLLALVENKGTYVTFWSPVIAEIVSRGRFPLPPSVCSCIPALRVFRQVRVSRPIACIKDLSVYTWTVIVVSAFRILRWPAMRTLESCTGKDDKTNYHWWNMQINICCCALEIINPNLAGPFFFSKPRHLGAFWKWFLRIFVPWFYANVFSGSVSLKMPLNDWVLRFC